MAPLHLGLVELSSFMPRECDDAKPLSDLSVLVANEDSGPNTPVDQKTIALQAPRKRDARSRFPTSGDASSSRRCFGGWLPWGDARYRA